MIEREQDITGIVTYSELESRFGQDAAYRLLRVLERIGGIVANGDARNPKELEARLMRAMFQ